MMFYSTPYDVTLLMLQSEHVSGVGAEWERSGKWSGAGRKASERERSGTSEKREERSGRSGNGNGAEVQKIGGACSGILACSRSAHMLWLQYAKSLERFQQCPVKLVISIS
jgi:hypothetical protein